MDAGKPIAPSNDFAQVLAGRLQRQAREIRDASGLDRAAKYGSTKGSDDQLWSEISLASDALATEKTARVGGDTNLQTNINTVQTNVNTVANNLSTETTARTTGDNNLQTNINTVQGNVNAATSRITTLEADVIAPNGTKSYVDLVTGGLSTRIDNLNAALNSLRNYVDSKNPGAPGPWTL